MKVEILEIGNERNKIIVIDDVFPHVEVLVKVAATRKFEDVTHSSYPGVRHVLTKDSNPEWSYVEGLIHNIGPVMHQVFGMDEVKVAHAAFSLMTRRPAEAHPLTRIPHYDELKKPSYAWLHFLSPRVQGGTGFYRQKRTGFERITPERKEAFHEALREDWAEFGEPDPVYINGSNTTYEQIGYFEGCFNRLLIYSGALLHSAHIPADFDYSADPRHGRLTSNLFLTVPVN